MKNVKTTVFSIALALVGILLFSAFGNKNQQQTESYAMVHVIEKSTRLIMRTTISGSSESVAKNLKLETVDKDFVDFIEVIKELERLNAMGYKLQSSSVSTIQYGTSKNSAANPYHSYVLVKK